MYALTVTALLLLVLILAVVQRNWGRIAYELTEYGETIYDDPLDPERHGNKAPVIDEDGVTLAEVGETKTRSHATQTVR